MGSTRCARFAELAAELATVLLPLLRGEAAGLTEADEGPC